MRGTTLLETLMAVALLSLVAVAAAAWIGVVADAEATAAPRVTATGALSAALRLIEDDLRRGDLASGRNGRGGSPLPRDPRDPRDPRNPRVRIDAEGRLLVETRDRGPIVRAYAFDAATGSLRADAGDGPRTLVEGLEAWEVRLDPEARTLEVSWTCRGTHGLRRWPLP